METSQAVLLPPLQSPLHSRPEELDLLPPRLGALAYQSIDSENGEIRLLEVLPGYYDDVIQINLHTKNLNDKPRYEALSYAWGTTPSSNRAIVNGCPIPVRESLDLGLRHLRLTDGPPTDPRDRIYGLLGIMKSYVAEPILPDYSKAWPQVLAEATMVMISEDGLFPYMIRGFVFPSTEQPKEGYRMPSWVLDISQRIRSDLLEDFEHYYQYAGHKLDSEGTERRRRSLRLSEDFRKLYKHGWHVGTIKSIFVFTPDFPMEGYGQNGRGMRAGLHDFYHQVLKSKGVAPSHLYEAIDSKLDSSYSLEKFVSSLQGHRDEFMPMYRFDRETDKFAVFLTEEGNVGATWLSNTFEIRADDIIVALFERQMPFILRPVPGQSTYRMVNLAYVSGLSGTYIEFHTNVTSGGLDKDEPVPNDWIYDAANGCFKYAIV
ncbi:unnamed protein product [Alternaria alternata]